MPVPRRALLRSGGLVLGVLVTAGLTGCTPNDPRVDNPNQTPYGPPSPSDGGPPVPTLPGASQAALVEADLLARVVAIRSHPRYSSLPGERRRLLYGLQTQHRWHVTALHSPSPTSRPSTPTPTPTPSASLSASSPSATSPPATSPRGPSTASPDSLGELTRGLAAAERSAAARHLATAERSTGFAALLFGSLTTAADSYAVALAKDDPPPPVRPGPVVAYTTWTGVEAEQNLLTQSHAAVYGLKAALGFISESTELGAGLYARVVGYERLRDQLRELLVGRRQNAPVAEPGYRLPIRVTDRASGLELAQRVESAMLPHVGRWVAAEPDPTLHLQALALLRSTAASAAAYGAGVQAWPGWV